MTRRAFSSRYPIAGIDFGSRYAGSTAIAVCFEDGSLRLLRSTSGEDSDLVISQAVADLKIRSITIDAPLSLPKIYRTSTGTGDFLFRRSDRELRALSPLFLGGLTARAIALARLLRSRRVQVYEGYPAAIVRELKIRIQGYKKGNVPSTVPLSLRRALGLRGTYPKVRSWHDIDALLALVTMQRILNGTSRPFGERREGQIWV
jgi:predicted nuclease with RNAse H fold